MFLVGYFIWPCLLPFLALLLVLAVLGVRDILFAIDLRSRRRATRGLVLLTAPAVLSLVCLLVWGTIALQLFQLMLHEAKTTTPPLDTHNLMIDVLAFPKDWALCMGPWPPPDRAAGERGESHSLSVQFCHDGQNCRNFGAEQGLFRYKNEAEARAAFERDFSLREFPDLGTSMLTGWIVPDGWTYQSKVADDLRFACARLDMGPVGPPEWRCTCVARYGEYISTLNSVLSPECMSLGDLARVVEAIDERMAQHLTETD